jgi:hypothetical protein
MAKVTSQIGALRSCRSLTSTKVHNASIGGNRVAGVMHISQHYGLIFAEIITGLAWSNNIANNGAIHAVRLIVLTN